MVTIRFFKFLKITNEKSRVLSGESAKEVGEKLRNFLHTMPCVFYDGPNGKKTKGYLLYSSVRREDLKIVCSCHASFLTPTEFVKHGGGGDVENPLKHIDIVLA
uniref:Ninja-family protein n=1 Tax=Solanum tuberosum TaxID=4113 RepID=M1B3T3_SOLTU